MKGHLEDQRNGAARAGARQRLTFSGLVEDAREGRNALLAGVDEPPMGWSLSGPSTTPTAASAYKI